MGATKKLYEMMIERHNSLENHFIWLEQEYLNNKNYETTDGHSLRSSKDH